MENTFEIQFKEEVIPAKVLMLIKKLTNKSISEIKNSAEQHVPFFGCNLSDDKGLSLIIEIYEQLNSLDIQTILLEDGEIETIDYFRNTLKSLKNTACYVGLEEDDLDY